MRPFSSVTSHIFRYEIQFEKRLLCDDISDNKWKKEAKKGLFGFNMDWSISSLRRSSQYQIIKYSPHIQREMKQHFSDDWICSIWRHSHCYCCRCETHLFDLSLPFSEDGEENMNTYSCTLHITTSLIHSLCGCISWGNGFDTAGLSLIN